MMQKISDLQHDLKRLDGSFKKAREAQLSSEENVDLYETELKMKKNYWKDAIAKEAKRRKAAESEAKRLKVPPTFPSCCLFQLSGDLGKDLRLR